MDYMDLHEQINMITRITLLTGERYGLLKAALQVQELGKRKCDVTGEDLIDTAIIELGRKLRFQANEIKLEIDELNEKAQVTVG